MDKFWFLVMAVFMAVLGYQVGVVHVGDREYWKGYRDAMGDISDAAEDPRVRGALDKVKDKIMRHIEEEE